MSSFTVTVPTNENCLFTKSSPKDPLRGSTQSLVRIKIKFKCLEISLPRWKLGSVHGTEENQKEIETKSR